MLSWFIFSISTFTLSLIRFKLSLSSLFSALKNFFFLSLSVSDSNTYGVAFIFSILPFASCKASSMKRNGFGPSPLAPGFPFTMFFNIEGLPSSSWMMAGAGTILWACVCRLFFIELVSRPTRFLFLGWLEPETDWALPRGIAFGFWPDFSFAK